MAGENLPNDAGTAAAASNLIGGATPYGWAAMGVSLLSGSSVNKSGATGQSDGQSGLAWFEAQNNGGIKKPLLALDNPVSVLVAAGVVIGAVYLVKKMRGK